MSKWLGNALKTLLNQEVNPTKVVEVKQDKFTERVVEGREDGIILYGPGGKNQNFYEIVLFRPSTDSSSIAYSIYRVPELYTAQEKFKSLKDKVPFLLNVSKDVCTVSNIQKICDSLHENPSWTIGHIAVQLNLLDIMSKKEIISSLSSPDPDNGLHPIHLAIKNLNLQAIKLMIGSNISLDALDHEGNTVYHFAAETNKDIISTLADNGPKYLNYRNASGHTPLHVACLADKSECVKAILLAGADPNIPSSTDGIAATTSPTGQSANIGRIMKTHENKIYEEDMKHGGTPLHWSRSREVIEDLLNHNCDLNALNFNKRTALHVMVLRERLECVVALLSHGCEINIKDQDGNTPLHIAAQKKNVAILQSLVIFGADINDKNSNNETARHILAGIPGDASKKALYIIHAVGAARCEDPCAKCAPGCHPTGTEDGIAPPTPRSYPVRGILNAYTQLKTPVKSEGDRALCLDGGGIRGLILVSVLLHIEQTVGRPIIDCFDWLSGTSTGAILALALASGKTLQECLCLYFLMKERIFVGSRPYPSEALESLLKEIFGNLFMCDIKKPRLIITGLAADMKPADMHIFRNYTPPGDLAFPDQIRNPEFRPPPKPEEQLVWKAARASGAAPSYFRMFEKYLDGGLVANNPTLDVLTEINEYNLALCGNGDDKPVKLSVLVSVGTGCIPVTEVKDIDVFRPESVIDGIKLVRGISALGTLLVDQATLSDGRVVDRARAWCSTLNVSFFRFSPQLSEEIVMDEKDDGKLVKMLWETKLYMVQHQEEVNKLIALLTD